MPQSRKSQVSLAATPYYHCISRCVRRAFLCGKDTVTGQSYEHRKQWVEDKLLFLPTVFAIDVCAYAVMSNHSHVVLHLNPAKAESWDTSETLRRWHQLFKGTFLTQQFLQGKSLTDMELITVHETAQVYKQRLMDISWFMRVLNEGIARAANREDDCTGRFWEGRFKSQALLDESALIACMAYVDLNPIRAQLAKTPEHAPHTSIKQRVKAALNNTTTGLMPFTESKNTQLQSTLPFSLKDYLELVDTTGRYLKEETSGYIHQHLPSILTRLNINQDNWLTLSQHFTQLFHGAVGSEDSLSTFMHCMHKKRRSNLSNVRKLFA